METQPDSKRTQDVSQKAPNKGTPCPAPTQRQSIQMSGLYQFGDLGKVRPWRK